MIKNWNRDQAKDIQENEITIFQDKQIIKDYNKINIKDKIFLEENVQFKYLLISTDSNIDIQFITNGDNVKWDIYAIFFGNKPISANITAQINNSNSHINIFLLSLISSDQLMDIQGNINLGKNIVDSQWHLLEKNVVLNKLWSNVKIKAIPRLDVYSNNVKASHGVSIDRINEDNLFYLSSKGLDQNGSQELIVKWYIQNILQKFTDLSDTDISDLENKILSQIICHSK